MTTWTPSFDASSLSADVPVLPKGVYAGHIKSAQITGKDNKQFFAIRKKTVWNKEDKQMEPVLDDNGNQAYEINARIMLQVALTSKRAAEILGRDEPVFLRWISINFDDKYQIDKNNNQVYRTLTDVIGITNEDFGSMVAFEFDPEVEVPEELAHVEDAVIMLNALEYWRQYFNFVCNAIKDQDVRVLIEQETASSGAKENFIHGEDKANRYTKVCGLLKYEAGCENDLVEE